MERWRDGEMERWRDGEMERWREGERENIAIARWLVSAQHDRNVVPPWAWCC
jgi:hypothetical protein